MYVDNEIGKLEKVIVHFPDEGISRISPKRAESLLFDDIVFYPLMGQEYNNGYKDDIGLIAQEVEEVLPDMVVTQKDGLKKIRYDISLQMRVITAMQEQQEIINDQEDIMQQQRQDIDMLISEVARLKELVGE